MNDFDKVIHKHVGKTSIVIVGKKDCMDKIVRLDLGDIEPKTAVENGVLVLENSNLVKYLGTTTIPCSQTVIFPANPNDIKRNLPRSNIIFQESPEYYNLVIKPDYMKNLNQNRKWVVNILTGISEQEKILHQDDHFVLLPDLKWNHNVNQIYCLAIVKRFDLHSIRDLSAHHIDLITHIVDTTKSTINKIYKTNPDKIRSYLHYYPSTWHLHIHFNLVDQPINSASSDFAIKTSDIIRNLKLDPNYYKNATIDVVSAK